MSILKERKPYLQLWSFTTGPAIDVMKHYFEVKVLNTSNFESFLNDINNMHKLFHQCFPRTQCCYCATISLAAPKKKGCINLGQFEKLYDNSGSPQPSHEIMKGYKVSKICLCKYSAKSSVTVNDLDITLFNDIVQHCCPSKLNSVWRLSIKDVRNFLAHAGTGCVNKQDFEDKWKTLSTATLGFAGELGKVCEKMFQTEIVRIKKCSSDELKDMLENSIENQAEMLNLLNGFKPTVEECKKTTELVQHVHIKQESHDKQLENIQSAIACLGQSTSNQGQLMLKMNNMESYMKLIVEHLEGKGKNASAGNKRIKIETHVDNSSWNEENTAKRLCRMSNADIDEESADKEKLYVTNVENKCLQIELVAFPDVFKSPHSLRKAIKILINQLIDAGEVDTSIPGRMDIEFTIKTLLTKEEMEVAFSVFGGQDNLEESTENGLDLKPKLQDHISVFQTVTTETKTSDNSDSEMDVRPIDDHFVTVKPESISARYDDFFITVENVKCLLKITGLPENVEVLEGTVQALDNKGSKMYYVELVLECPKTWNDGDVYANMNINLSKLHGFFHIDFLEQPSDGKITLQTTVDENVFLSKTSLESAFQQLLSRIRTVCNVQSSKYEELSVTAAVLSVSDQRGLEDEKKTIKEELKKSPITTEDNNVKCQFCKKEFECYKCTATIERIRVLSRANRMKEQTISRLENTSLQTEKEITEEPEHKKRKTAITSDIEKSKDNQTEDAGKSLNHIKVDMKQALLKLGEIPLLDYCIDIYKNYLKNLRAKWGRRDIKPKNEQAIKDRLVREKEKRTVLIAKLKDVIHNQDVFKTTDESYSTDRRFLDVDENPATKCNYCHIKEACQISCYDKDFEIFVCDNCLIEHRMKNKNHNLFYQSEILREYKLTNSWGQSMPSKMIDLKFVAADIVAILRIDKLCIYTFAGDLINSFSISTVEYRISRIACINNYQIAVTEPGNNLIKMVTIVAPTTMTDLGTPTGTNMTGGITCRMDILYVAFSDAIRLMDLSGQIQRVVNIPSVNILHSVNNDKMLCVYSKDDSEKTMSCFDFTNGSLYDFERFPFHPKDITTDDIGNIIFIENGVIWQADSDGTNIKVIMSPVDVVLNAYETITYNKDSKCLFAYKKCYNGVKVYRKLE